MTVGRDGVSRGDGLEAGGADRDGERVRAGVGGGEGVVGREDRGRVGAGEVDGAGVGRAHVVGRVQGGDGDRHDGAGVARARRAGRS